MHFLNPKVSHIVPPCKLLAPGLLS